MDIESKIWNYSNTGTKLHAFLDGVAICRSSIRRPGAEHTALDYCEAKSHSVCATCDTKFNAAIERAENSMEPSTGEGDYLPPAETRHNPTEEARMGNSHRPTTGPFTPVQQFVLMGLVQGKTQREIATETGVRESYVSAELAIARQKMNCSTTAHAVSTMATALAYLQAAKLIEADVKAHPASGHEWYANELLAGLAKILRDRAAALLPK